MCGGLGQVNAVKDRGNFLAFDFLSIHCWPFRGPLCVDPTQIQPLHGCRRFFSFFFLISKPKFSFWNILFNLLYIPTVQIRDTCLYALSTVVPTAIRAPPHSEIETCLPAVIKTHTQKEKRKLKESEVCARSVVLVGSNYKRQPN